MKEVKKPHERLQNMGVICLHCVVSGRVQGVFYRRETYQQAVARGLKGYVKNLADGRVGVMICGEQTKVEAMRDWLWEGSLASEVTDVEVHEVDFQEYPNFEVR